MSKEKDFFRLFMHKFVSVTIYILMVIVAIFIFYKAVILILYVFLIMKEQISELPAIIAGVSDKKQLLGIKVAEEILNVVTFLLVLVKSFKILKTYSVHHHIAIRDLVEISIIALLMEVVFNFGLHTMGINILFSVLGVALVIVYATIPFFREDPRKEKH